MNVFDTKILKKDGTFLCDKVYLMYIEETISPCDGCNEIKKLAYISGLGIKTLNICQNCLLDFANAFNEKD